MSALDDIVARVGKLHDAGKTAAEISRALKMPRRDVDKLVALHIERRPAQ